MSVIEAIKKRRAYRSLSPVEIHEELINDLAHSAQMFCSCFNNQPWRYIFVYDKSILIRLFSALSPGNEWAQSASMIIAVFSKPEFDCIMKDGRRYYLFDTGMATAALILMATELGFVAHPIAGYDQQKVKQILDIPEDMEVITLIIFGKKADTINPLLSEKQTAAEKNRPERLPIEKFIWHNQYQK